MVANKKISIKDLKREVAFELSKDLIAVTEEAGKVIDENITQKFSRGFPENELQKSTIKRKGSSQVGIKTGALFRAATAFTNYKVFQPTVGNVRPLLTKQKRGLTPYSEIVATKIGGELDYLEITSKDKVILGNAIGRLLAKRGYRTNNQIRVIRKSVDGDKRNRSNQRRS